MIIDGLYIYAEPGRTLRRKSDGVYVGISYHLGYIYYINGQKLEQRHFEQPEDFEELTRAEVGQSFSPSYNDLVDQFIREQYTVSDELAIQRQRDTKPDAFQEYFNYCEECKKRAWHDLGLDSIEFAK